MTTSFQSCSPSSTTRPPVIQESVARRRSGQVDLRACLRLDTGDSRYERAQAIRSEACFEWRRNLSDHDSKRDAQMLGYLTRCLRLGAQIEVRNGKKSMIAVRSGRYTASCVLAALLLGLGMLSIAEAAGRPRNQDHRPPPGPTHGSGPHRPFGSSVPNNGTRPPVITGRRTPPIVSSSTPPKTGGRAIPGTRTQCLILCGNRFEPRGIKVMRPRNQDHR